MLSGLMSGNIARGWAMIQDNQEGMNQIMGKVLGDFGVNVNIKETVVTDSCVLSCTLKIDIPLI